MKAGPDALYLSHYYEAIKLLAYPDPGSPLFKALTAARVDPYGLEVVPAKFAHLSGKPWTIARGDTGPDVVCGLRCTAEEAEERYQRRLEREFEPGVESAIKSGATQKQFDAFVDLAYNIGVPRFRTSSALIKHNARDYEGASRAILLWNLSNGVVMKGLQRRRWAGRLVYLGAEAADAVKAADKAYP